MDKESKNERKRMILAMEYIARQINFEPIFEKWLMCGVADEDIDYGEADIETIPDDDYYIEPENFREIMNEFLDLMTEAKQKGGLYCGGVTSKKPKYNPNKIIADARRKRIENE